MIRYVEPPLVPVERYSGTRLVVKDGKLVPEKYYTKTYHLQYRVINEYCAISMALMF